MIGFAIAKYSEESLFMFRCRFVEAKSSHWFSFNSVI